MVRAFTILAMVLASAWLVTGCQELTGATMGEKIDDETLTSYVKTKLAEDGLNTLTRMEVETDNENVYLTGAVETAQEKSRMGSLARQVEGVKTVDNYLQVLPSRYGSGSRRWTVFCAPLGKSELAPSISGTGAQKCFGLYK